MYEKIYLSSFDGADAVARFKAAADYMRQHPATTLVVEPDVYELTSELARDSMENVLSGAYGRDPQSTMFNPRFIYTKGIDLDGLTDCRVEAYGATFLIDGFMEPVSVTNCRNVEICGFTVEHKRKPYARGFVTEAGEIDENGNRVCIITLDKDSPVCEKTPFLRSMAYDPATDRRIPLSEREARVLDAHHLRIRFGNAENIRIGMEYLNAHTYHSRPAILIEYSENIRVTDVTIHDQPGMGVVGNRSSDVFLTRLNVEPSCGHHYSTNTDATHFTSMTGKLRLENCRFSWQGDDLTNVHAYYHAIIARESPNVCLMQEKTPDGTHAQTLDYPDVGDTLELTDMNTLQTVDSFRVVACEPMPEEWMSRVTLDHPLPECTEGLALSDVTRLPELEVIGCYSAHHYARGVLIKCRNARIEDNFFYDINGAGVVVAAESYWYEGVTPANVIIRRNRFEQCAVLHGEAAGVTVKADAPEPVGQSIRNIVIEDNIVYAPASDHAFYIRNADGVIVRRNCCTVKGEPTVTEKCVNVTVEE